MLKIATGCLLLLFLVVSCNSAKQDDGVLFSLMPPAATRVDFINQITESEQFNIIDYLYFNNGAGVAAGDINNDGLVDLYFTSNQLPNKLYLNKGKFRFEDISEKAGVSGEGDWKTGVTMADVNGDGLLDIYICQVADYKGLRGKNQLFINQGDLTFRDEAQAYGLDFRGFSTQAAFFDYDLDGDLDMYLLNHSVHTSRSYGRASLRFGYDLRAGDRLFRNDELQGRRVFRDITRYTGIYSSQIGYGLGVNISDINDDGFPDIYVCNDFHENDYLYVNKGDGTYSERLTEMMGHTSRSSMGNDVGDINNDGLLDVVTLDMLPDEQQILKQSGGEDDNELFQLKLEYGYYHQFVRNMLQLNVGDGKFIEIGRLSGIWATDWSWSPLFCDVDNDGWKDLFITNGIYRRANDLDYISFLTGGNRFSPMRDNRGVTDKTLYEKMPLYPNINYIFRNNGDLTFSNMASSWGFNTRSFSNGSTYADLDNDGDLDLVVNNINSQAAIYRNNASSITGNHYLSVILKGSGMNTRGVGTRITLFCGQSRLVAEQYATHGYLSSTSDVLHIGLGSVEVIDSLVIRWPDRSLQVHYLIPADQQVTFEMGMGKLAVSDQEASSVDQRLLSELRIRGVAYRHQEDPYRDLSREKLIPHDLSSEGPALAVGDVNGDGLDDLFVGGARGQSALLVAQQADGSFSRMVVPQFIEDRDTEDVDAVFFDADGDHDLDLYIVRGGNEVPIGNPLLEDRLLLNNGTGRFLPCDQPALPWMTNNGSCARPADFDGDGDLDLFVASRSVPGSYGMPPAHVLLENRGKGYFSDVTHQRIPGLSDAGMITDAVWVDHDLDGDQDLVVAGEWTRITIFRNDTGAFHDATAEAGLSETSGWWNCIHAVDIDLDGDLDLVGGNLGLNSMLKASVSEPVEMYVGDFDNNGSTDQVICSYVNGASYPIATLDELSLQIAGLKEKYASYSEFGGKTTGEIFDSVTLAQSLLFRSVLLESTLFLNNGDATFGLVRLPIVAQTSPIRDLWMEDLDRDGVNDLLVVGNDYTARPSIGRYDASYGWCLLGGPDRVFKPLNPVESGFLVRGDARKIRSLTIGGEAAVVVAVNSGELQFFRY